MKTYAARFISNLRRAERTREEYRRDLRLFIKWCEAEGKLEPQDVSSADIEAFLVSLVRKDGIAYSAASRNRVLAVIKGYYKFLVRDRVIEASDDPAAHVVTQKKPRRAPVFLELDEGARMILAVRDRTTKTVFQETMRARDMAVLALLLGSGLRISELVSLNLETWREVLMNGWLTIVGKGDKERIVPPSDEAVEHVEEYLRVRPVVAPDRRGNPLFVSRKNQRLSKTQIERLVRSLAREAGLTKRITPHKLRATWVTQLLISGANPREVQRLAGHDSLDTTMLYAGVRDNEELRETVRRHQVRYL